MSYTLTVRLHDGVKADLDAAAGAAGVPASTLAGQYIREALARGGEVAPESDPPEPGDGPLVAAVRARFEGIGGLEADVRRETALHLAALVEARGPGAAAASRRLDEVLAIGAAPAGIADLLTKLSEPVHTFCQGCRRR